MDMNKFEHAPDEVTIHEAAGILDIPADWVVAKIDSGLPAYIFKDLCLVQLRSLIPCADKVPTSIQAYYLDTRIPRTDMKPNLLYYVLVGETDDQGDYISSFDDIRILKKDLLGPTAEVATLKPVRPVNQAIKLSYEDFVIITNTVDPLNLNDFAFGHRADKNGIWAIRPEPFELAHAASLEVLRPINGWDTSTAWRR